MDLDIDSITKVALLEGVDDAGRLTDDPTIAVEGTLVVTFHDGATSLVPFDRVHAIPRAMVRS